MATSPDRHDVALMNASGGAASHLFDSPQPAAPDAGADAVPAAALSDAGTGPAGAAGVLAVASAAASPAPPPVPPAPVTFPVRLAAFKRHMVVPTPLRNYEALPGMGAPPPGRFSALFSTTKRRPFAPAAANAGPSFIVGDLDMRKMPAAPAAEHDFAFFPLDVSTAHVAHPPGLRLKSDGGVSSVGASESDTVGLALSLALGDALAARTIADIFKEMMALSREPSVRILAGVVKGPVNRVVAAVDDEGMEWDEEGGDDGGRVLRVVDAGAAAAAAANDPDMAMDIMNVKVSGQTLVANFGELKESKKALKPGEKARKYLPPASIEWLPREYNAVTGRFTPPYPAPWPGRAAAQQPAFTLLKLCRGVDAAGKPVLASVVPAARDVNSGAPTAWRAVGMQDFKRGMPVQSRVTFKLHAGEGGVSVTVKALELIGFPIAPGDGGDAPDFASLFSLQPLPVLRLADAPAAAAALEDADYDDVDPDAAAAVVPFRAKSVPLSAGGRPPAAAQKKPARSGASGAAMAPPPAAAAAGGALPVLRGVTWGAGAAAATIVSAAPPPRPPPYSLVHSKPVNRALASVFDDAAWQPTTADGLPRMVPGWELQRRNAAADAAAAATAPLTTPLSALASVAAARRSGVLPPGAPPRLHVAIAAPARTAAPRPPSAAAAVTAAAASTRAPYGAAAQAAYDAATAAAERRVAAAAQPRTDAAAVAARAAQRTAALAAANRARRVAAAAAAAAREEEEEEAASQQQRASDAAEQIAWDEDGTANVLPAAAAAAAEEDPNVVYVDDGEEEEAEEQAAAVEEAARTARERAAKRARK